MFDHNFVRETSLSKLSEHDWKVLSSRHSRGIDWMVHKMGRHWVITPSELKGFPLFKTKREAYEAADNLILAESHWRLHCRMTADGYIWNGERYVRAA